MPTRFLNNITVNDEYTLPPADGTENQIIVTDGVGNLSFDDLSAISSVVTNVQSDTLYYEVKNSTGTTIETFKGVMAVGTDGNSGHILVDEMVANGTVEARYFLGITQEAIPNGGIGRVIAFGEIDQVNTNAFPDGTILWCDPASPGNFTATEPDGPNLKIPAAFVLNQATNGKIQVRVQGHEGIKDLYDTKITSQVDGDVLVWKDTEGIWQNDSTLNVDYTNSRIGIGTTDPINNLHLHSTDVISVMKISNSTSGLGAQDGVNIVLGNGFSQLWYYENGYFRIATNNAERMRITSTGNVGIGTTNPSRELDVDGNIQLSDPSFVATRGLYGTNGAIITFNGLNFDNEIAGGGIRINTFLGLMNFKANGSNDFLSHNDSDGATIFSYSGSEKMRIQGSGNVGVNVTNPQARFEINGPNHDANFISGCLMIQQDNGSRIFIDGNDIDCADGTLYLNDYSLNEVRTGGNFTVPNGSVGIGTTGPQAKLHVANGTLRTWTPLGGTTAIFESTANSRSFVTITGANEAELWFGNASTQTKGRVRYEMAGDNMEFWTNASQKMVINSSGNVGINTTNPTQKLHVNGGTLANICYLTNTSYSLSVYYGYLDLQSTNGVLVRQGLTYEPIYASAFNVSSDYRLKSNIAPLENAIDRLNQLDVHRFNWNDRLDEPKVDGFIAHEVAPIIPEAVSGEKDAVHEDGTPRHQGIDQSKIVPLLTAALQEAIAKIESLEARVQILENQ